jgi:signal transduction histidine kinase/CheY-like chemotaxis protein
VPSDFGLPVRRSPRPEEIERHVRTSNRIGWLFTILSTPWAWIFFHIGDRWSAFLITISCILFAGTPITNALGRHKLGRGQPLVAGTFIISTLTLQHGVGSWMPVFIFAVVPLPPLTFSLSERRTMWALELFLSWAFLVSVVMASPEDRTGLLVEAPWLPNGVVLTTFVATTSLVLLTVNELRRQQEMLWQVAERSQRAEREANEAKQKAEAANRAKDEFVATVSHEIRTPLNGVLGMAELLRATPLTTPQRDMVRTIIRSGEFLRLIINDILDFSKIVAGQMELEETPFFIGDLLEQTQELLSATASSKRLALCMDVDMDADIELVGDAGRLRQIVTNLVNNAVKFTEAGFVETRVRLEQTHGSVRLHLEVEDSGIGIDHVHRHRIFQPFYQSDSSHTRRFGGTGLGLTICRRIAIMMGGELTFESEMGKGTTFRFTAPFATTGAWSSYPRFTSLNVAVHAPTERRRIALRRSLVRVGAKPVELHGTDDPRLLADLVVVDTCLMHEPLDVAAFAAEHGLHPQRVVQVRPRDKCRELVDIYYPCSPATVHRTLEHAIRDMPSEDHQGDELTDGVTLPRLAPDEQLPQFPSVHVLVAEDNPINQLVIQGFLSRLGVSCDIVGDGVAAHEEFDAENHQLVFMDLSMPRLNGTEAAIRIRQDAPCHVPIVATTAHASDEARNTGSQLGFDDYLTKPLELEAFIRVFRRFRPSAEQMNLPREVT